jgi:hypothetical protein
MFKMYRVTLLVLLLFSIAAADQGWLVATKDKAIDFDLDATPLELKTDSTIGSGEIVNLVFYPVLGGPTSGGLSISFSDPPQYIVVECSQAVNFPADLPTATDNNREWRVTLTRNSSVRMLIQCNGEEVLNFLLSDSTCTGFQGWKMPWTMKTMFVYFESDTATDFYRAVKLECEAPTVKDGKVSPSTAISTGSSYTVTCNEGYSIKGSNDISCTEKDGKATLSDSPTCEKDAKDEDKTKFSFANCLKVNAALLVVLITAALLI